MDPSTVFGCGRVDWSCFNSVVNLCIYGRYQRCQMSTMALLRQNHGIGCLEQVKKKQLRYLAFTLRFYSSLDLAARLIAHRQMTARSLDRLWPCCRF